MSDGRTPILYIAPWVDLGGTDKGTIDWFKHIDRDRWAPSLITTTPSPNRWLHHIEPYAEEVWDLPDLMPGSAFPEFILGFIESRGIRVVHIMNARFAFDLLPDMTCLPEPPAVVVQLHTEEPNQGGYVRYVARRYSNLVDAFSVVSHHLKDTLAGYEVPRSRIDVIHLGVDGLEEFHPGRTQPLKLDGIGNGVRRILWPGRVSWEKDPMLTLEVVARARDRGASFVLDVVGEGHLKDSARARAEELAIADIIQWHPPSQEMPRWYRSSDLLLMTSVYEGVPRVIYEALAMEVPVVAPALPGNLELMDPESGVLVDPRDDVDRYAEAIVTLLQDDDRRKKMGEHSRRRMLTEFSPAEMARRHGELYERLLAGRPASSMWRNEELLGETPATPVEPVAVKTFRFERDPSPERTVGVIVPCYRHGIFLDGCIASIKAQTLRPAAIVVVDDASPDPETIEALARLDDDPDVTVLRQPENSGPSAARNRGLAELSTSYVLPVDADDELLPDALERMVAQLEKAPSDVGFVYPQWDHIGNQFDRVEVPTYNIWLLMEQNYCAYASLFDRRLFEEAGHAYAEEIVVGHEDWDLILELAEHGIRGIPTDTPTLLYRKQGFSRVNAVDYGPDPFYETIENRHPHLFLNSDRIKAEWAPALSIVLLDEESTAWKAEDLTGLERQTCRDFETVARGDVGESARRVGDVAESPFEWVQTALDEARGRWVLLLPRSARAVFDARSSVEQLIHAFYANPGVPAVAFADPPGLSRATFAQLDDTQRLFARPGAVAFERPLWGRVPDVPLGIEDSLMADLVIGLRMIGPMQWRVAPVGGEAEPWLYASGGPEGVEGLDVNVPVPADAAQAIMRHTIVHQKPRLPELTPDTVRRWKYSEIWTPPQTRLLCRHLNLKTGFRMMSPDPRSPADHRLEQVLGCTHLFPSPGNRRLIHASHSYKLGDAEDKLVEGEYDMGYVEQEAFVQMVALELRRVPDSGQEVLVAGADDPLIYNSEVIETLGWIDAYPILPRAADVLHTGPWAVVSLRRQVDYATWRHCYRVEPPGELVEGIELGSLCRHPGPGLVALRLRSDGRLASELCTPGRATRDPRRIGRWLAEPLRADAPPGARARGAGSRLRHLATDYGSRRLAEDEGEVLGHLPRQNMPGTSTLYSTIHPVTGDQLVTRSPEEATAAGYVMDGILGAIFDPPAAATPPEEMPWARISRV